MTVSTGNTANTNRNRPINIAAERAVLAGITKYGSKAYMEISDIINEECFTSPDNHMVFKVSKHVLESSDTIDVPAFLSAATSLGYGDLTDKKDVIDYVKSIFLFGVNQEHIRKNSVMLRKLQIARKGQDIAKDIYSQLGMITGNESIGEIISTMESPVLGMDFGTDSNEDKTVKLGDYFADTMKQFELLDGKVLGVPSPFAKYNQLIGGGRRPGYVYLISARPKQGKTQIAIVDALHVSINCGIPVLYLDTEMKMQDMIARIASSLSNTPFPEVETGNYQYNDFQKAKIREATETMEKANFFYRKVSGKPFEEILSIIRKWIIQEIGLENGKAKPCLVIYDYFKLMDTSALKEMQEYQAMGFQISALSDFAGKYDFPISAYVQLNRQGDISQSDRLLWLCASHASLSRKSPEETLLDGPENGNTKLIPTTDQRFGPGLEEGDWINLHFQYDRCRVSEGLTNREVKKNRKQSNSGFQVDDDAEAPDTEDTQDGFSDSDFDSSSFRDDQYRGKNGNIHT